MIPSSEGDSFADLESEVPDVPESPELPAQNLPCCEVCDASIPWSGRGRRPKRCADHKTRTASSGSTQSRRSTKNDARLQEIRDGLTGAGAKVGGSIGKWMPVTGIVVLSRSERFADAAVKLAKDHPKLLNGLEKVARADPALEMVETLAAIVAATSVDMGKTAPTGLVMGYLGVASAYYQIYPEGDNPSGQNGFRPTAPSSTVGFIPARVG